MEAISAPQTDRRGAQRQRTLLACRIIYGETLIAVEGVVRNQSETGALVRTPSPVALPSRVKLMLVKSGQVVDAKVVWRRDCDIGLQLGLSVALEDVADESVEALRRLWLSLAGYGQEPL